MYIHQTECLFTIILINTTILGHFTLLYAILLPFAPLRAPLRYFTLLYSTLLYLGTSLLWGYRNGPERTSVLTETYGSGLFRPITKSAHDHFGP